jgi:hypothetical protein
VSHSWLAIVATIAGCWTGDPPPPATPTVPARIACPLYELYVRHEASPRSPAFDAAAKAFDQATADYAAKRYREAELGFLRAADAFQAAGDEADRTWAAGNATSAHHAVESAGSTCSP